MLLPADVMLRGVLGATFDVEFQLLQTVGETGEPFPLTGYIVELRIDGIGVLTASDGLTINETQGVVSATLTPKQTQKVPPDVSWRLWLTDAMGNESVPIKGSIGWEQP